MPLAIPGSSSGSSTDFRQSSTRRIVKKITQILLQTRISPFHCKDRTQFSLELEDENVIEADLPLLCDSISKSPIAIDVFLCIDNSVHIPLEKWSFSLLEPQQSNSLFVDDLEEDDINTSQANILEKSLTSFLKLLPFQNYTQRSPKKSFPWKVEYGRAPSALTSLKTDELNKFSFHPVQTAFGKLILSVEYLPQVNFLIGPSSPILVVQPSASKLQASCHCKQGVLPEVLFSPTGSSALSLSPISPLLNNSISPGSGHLLVSSPLRELLEPGASGSFRNLSISPPDSLERPSFPIIPKIDRSKPNTVSPSFSPPRPGTPPPSRLLLSRSAPVGIPRPKAITNLECGGDSPPTNNSSTPLDIPSNSIERIRRIARSWGGEERTEE